jgi:hypothetical protein
MGLPEEREVLHKAIDLDLPPCLESYQAEHGLAACLESYQAVQRLAACLESYQAE